MNNTDDAITPKVEVFDPADPTKVQLLADALGSALAQPLKPAAKRTHQFIEVSRRDGVLDATLVEMKRRGVKVLGFEMRAGKTAAEDMWRIKVML